jgi:CRISPR-associated protein Csm3
MSELTSIPLYGRLFITAQVRAVTGLHIGSPSTALEIGGLDKIVIRDPLTNQPYIPGSSLRGKMRSLLEKHYGLKQNKDIRGQEPKVRIHECKKEEDAYDTCPVCQIFGVAGENQFAMPGRVLVRDVMLSPNSRKRLEKAHTDLPFTEVKWEAAIDRITAAAVPRQFERVPAGAVFGPLEIVYSFYREQDAELLGNLFMALELLEDDYVGGMGSRGYGQVALEGLSLTLKPKAFYERATDAKILLISGIKSVDELRKRQDEIVQKIRANLWNNTDTTE